jgi:hypothetical protein
MLNLVYGSTVSIPLIRCLASDDTHSGISNIPDVIFYIRSGRLSSSNGRCPQSKAYSMTPQDHISNLNPSYDFFYNTSGDV